MKVMKMKTKKMQTIENDPAIPMVLNFVGFMEHIKNVKLNGQLLLLFKYMNRNRFKMTACVIPFKLYLI
jgi:hypothetical protein